MGAVVLRKAGTDLLTLCGLSKLLSARLLKFNLHKNKFLVSWHSLNAPHTRLLSAFASVQQTLVAIAIENHEIMRMARSAQGPTLASRLLSLGPLPFQS